MIRIYRYPFSYSPIFLRFNFKTVDNFSQNGLRFINFYWPTGAVYKLDWNDKRQGQSSEDASQSLYIAWRFNGEILDGRGNVIICKGDC